MAYIGLFVVVIAICSWISIPTVVPFTLQTFAIFLAVTVLGGKRGTLSVIVYVLLGAVGLPVFSGFKGGIGALLNTTGGYIIGFIFSAFVIWAFEKALGKKTWALILSMVIALAAATLSAPPGLWSFTQKMSALSVFPQSSDGASFHLSSRIWLKLLWPLSSEAEFPKP